VNDDELLARLRAADPASSPGAPEPDLDRLVEATMATQTQPSTRPVRRGRWLIAAASAAVVAAGGIGWGLAGHDNNNQPVAIAPAAAPLKLTVGGGAAGKCRAVEVGDIRRMQVAFEGTATAMEGELVTLHVDRWYHGGTASTVEVRSDADAVATLLGVEFKVGESYLVTATKGQVSLCGESGPSNPDLRTLYQQAFPR
jgi:hypothetical protein